MKRSQNFVLFLFVSQALSPPAFRLPESVSTIIVGLCRVLTALRATDLDILYICTRLVAAAADFHLLFDRWRENRLQAARKRPQSAKAQASKAALRPKSTLPRKFAWLVNLVPETAIYGAQLQELLADPEIAALLAEVPQAGKHLRPLCRMLGVKPIPEIHRRQDANPGAPTLEITPLETAPLEIPPQKRFNVPTAIDPAQPADGNKSGTQPKPVSPAEPAPTEAEFFLKPT